MSTLYMKGKPESIADYVIFSGDPWRVDVFGELLDDIEEIGFFREYNTLTGTYKGVRITATSTGMGAPSAIIAMEEMYECGMKVALRMGTVMAFDNEMVGDFLIPLGSMRLESTSDRYIEKSYPAISDFDLVNAMNQIVRRRGYKSHNGIHATLDGYYVDMKESRFSREREIRVDENIKKLEREGILGADMESSAMMTVGRLMGVKTGVLTLATVSKNLERSLSEEERIHMERELCIIALDTMVELAEKDLAE